MAVPRNRTSNARKNSRRSHMAKAKKQTQSCKNCQTAVLSHRICPSCGFYDMKSVVQKDQNEEKSSS